MAQQQQYLRQLGTGHIFIRTEALAKRKDMVPYDPEVAKIRITQIKEALAASQKEENLEEMKKAAEEISSTAKELTELEKKAEEAIKEEEAKIASESGQEIQPGARIETDEETPEQAAKRKIDEDPQIMKIRGMTRKAQVEEYMLMEFGTPIDTSKTLAELKQFAEQARIQRMAEAVEG